METVDNGDNMVKVSIPAKIVTCQHSRGAFAELYEKVGEAPLLIYQRFPAEGCVWISRETLIVTCKGCRGLAEASLGGSH